MEKLTANDIKKIKEEIDYRTNVLRPQIVAEVAEAAAQGDRSENYEYKAAKEANRKNNGRIGYLERLLKNSVVITDDAKEDEVGLNKVVVLHFEDDDEEDDEEFKLVTSIRSSSLKNYISIESPLGKAIRGHKAGDVVLVKLENGSGYEVEIKSVSPEADDSQDEINGY